MGDAEYVAKQHICVGHIFVLFEPFSYVRAANLVMHKIPDPPVGVKTGGSRVGGPDLCVLG